MEELRIYGITKIASIQLGFDITDDAYDHTQYANRKIETSIAADYDISADTYKKAVKEGIWETVYDCSIDYFAEEELYNEGDVQIISEALMTNKDGEHVILLEEQNNSQNMLYGVVDDDFINGLKDSDCKKGAGYRGKRRGSI